MDNSFASVHPELILEWSERNLPLTPDDITFGSNILYWWHGACGHEWTASAKSRSSGEKCPICSGSRILIGFNDLASLRPDLVEEWSEKNEIKPTEVTIEFAQKGLMARQMRSRMERSSKKPCRWCWMSLLLPQSPFERLQRL